MIAVTVARVGIQFLGLERYVYQDPLILLVLYSHRISNPNCFSQQASKPTTPSAAPTDEEKKAERLAKLEAWKQKQAAERERKQRETAASGGPKNILEEIDRKSGVSPTVSTPQSPAAPVTDATPAAPARKFDPKAIAKSATPAAATPSVLGDDVAVPEAAKASAAHDEKPSTATSCK